MFNVKKYFCKYIGHKMKPHRAVNKFDNTNACIAVMKCTWCGEEKRRVLSIRMARFTGFEMKLDVNDEKREEIYDRFFN